MSVSVKSDALRELVDENAEVEKVATGFTFTEGPIWNAVEQCLFFSDMPGDVRRCWSEADGVREVMNPSNKCNGMTYDARGQPARLRARHELARPRAARRHARDDRLALRGQGAEQPERRHRPLRRDDLLLRSLVRPHAGLRRGARAASSASRASTRSRRAAASPSSSSTATSSSSRTASASRPTSRSSTSTTRRGP